LARRQPLEGGSALWGPSLVSPGLVALLLMAAAPAPRTPHAPLRLDMVDCEDVDTAVVNRVLSMELGASLAEGGGVPTTAHSECRATEARVTIDDPVTGKISTRVLDLKGQPRDMRSRLLGMAISEAVLASRIEHALKPETAPPLTRPVATRAATDVASDHLAATWRGSLVAKDEMTVGPVARWFASGLVVGGLEVGAVKRLRLFPRVGVAVDVDAGYGERSTDNVGRASATSFSLASCLVTRANLGSLLAIAGLGWRGALVRLAGEPTDSLRVGHTTTAAWTGPYLALAFSVELSRVLFLRAGMESGRVLLPARGALNGVQAIALDGAWLGGEISLGMKL